MKSLSRRSPPFLFAGCTAGAGLKAAADDPVEVDSDRELACRSVVLLERQDHHLRFEGLCVQRGLNLRPRAAGSSGPPRCRVSIGLPGNQDNVVNPVRDENPTDSL